MMGGEVVRFLNREGQPTAAPLNDLQVQRLRWESLGGPAEELLSAAGEPRDLERLIPYLGQPVEVLNACGDRLWWGFLAAVQVGALSFDLRRVANRIRAGYTFSVDEGGVQVMERLTTDWAEDILSQRDYGVHEKILSLGAVGAAAAQSARDQALAARGRLTPHWVSTGLPAGQVTLTCLGWAATLGWRMYANPAGLESYTVTGVGVQALGDAGSESRLAQAWQAATSGWDLDAVWIKAARAGEPTDALVAGLYADAGGVPGNTLLASGSLAGSALSAETTWVRLALTPTLNLDTVPWWLVLSRSGAPDSLAFYKVKVNETAGYARGVLRVWNGSAWVGRAPDADLNFSLLGKRDTTDQMADIAAATACGAFLRGVRCDSASGLATCPYREGSRTGWQEIKALLAVGTAAGGSLLAEVLPDRRLWIHAQPGEVRLRQTDEGELQDAYGQAVRADQALNQWVRLPGGETQFITAIERDAAGKLQIKAAGGD